MTVSQRLERSRLQSPTALVCQNGSVSSDRAGAGWCGPERPCRRFHTRFQRPRRTLRYFSIEKLAPCARKPTIGGVPASIFHRIPTGSPPYRKDTTTDTKGSTVSENRKITKISDLSPGGNLFSRCAVDGFYAFLRFLEALRKIPWDRIFSFCFKKFLSSSTFRPMKENLSNETQLNQNIRKYWVFRLSETENHQSFGFFTRW